MILNCYNLIEEKKMQDGNLIPKNVKLYCIKSEEDVLFLLYEDELKNKILFWARMEELVFECEEDKEFDVNFDDVINGEYFNLI